MYQFQNGRNFKLEILIIDIKLILNFDYFKIFKSYEITIDIILQNLKHPTEAFYRYLIDFKI